VVVFHFGEVSERSNRNEPAWQDLGTEDQKLIFDDSSQRHDLPFYLPHFVKLQKSCESLLRPCLTVSLAKAELLLRP
jgi:hypothetical protein